MSSPSRKGPVKHVLDMHNIEASLMAISVNDGSCPSHVSAASNHHEVSDLKWDVVDDFAELESASASFHLLNEDRTHLLTKSKRTESLTLMLGSGYLMVRPSWVRI